MKSFIRIDNFLHYFNSKYLKTRTAGAASFVLADNNICASIVIKSEQNYKENVTVEFVLRFKHNEELEGEIFQREFAIEHHPIEKSSHTEPHVQIYMHSPAPNKRLGELWIPLQITQEEQYLTCILGFISLLGSIMDYCKKGLSNELLDGDQIGELMPSRKYLLSRINNSLRSRLIGYKSPKGERIIIHSEHIERLASRDNALLAFFGNEDMSLG